ncbi:unnamed protein product [Euphydryas editha]|nr:unnamed protein product [Euphydryas editha]
MSRFHATVGGLSTRMDAFERRLEAVERVRERPSAEVDDYRGEVARLQQELHERDREALLADVEIGHLPEERGENVVHAVTVLAARLGVALDERDIVFAERVGAPPTPAGSPGAAPPWAPLAWSLSSEKVL